MAGFSMAGIALLYFLDIIYAAAADSTGTRFRATIFIYMRRLKSSLIL